MALSEGHQFIIGTISQTAKKLSGDLENIHQMKLVPINLAIKPHHCKINAVTWYFIDNEMILDRQCCFIADLRQEC